MKKFILLPLFIALLISCSGADSKEKSKTIAENAVADKLRTNNFEMIDEVKSETSGKAQLLEYAVYKDTIYTKGALKDVVMNVYHLNRDKQVFESHAIATVLAVYLFTSRDAYKDKSNWIAMLIKRPGVQEPGISFNDFKITALNNITDTLKNKDEIELEKITAYLAKRGMNLCSLSDLLKKIELENIHKADARYPDYGDEHMAMIDRLDAESYRNLKRKYKLSEDVLSKVSMFAMSYCK